MLEHQPPSKKIRNLCAELGFPYEIKTIDYEPVIYRDLGNGYAFEVSGVNVGSKGAILYVWQTSPHREVMGVYKNIEDSNLKDVLGYYAFVYRKLQAVIRVEREDTIV